MSSDEDIINFNDGCEIDDEKISNQQKRRTVGFMADDFISISPDFDTCMDGMEEYI